MTDADVLGQFRAALMSRGILPPAQIIADGNLHRCDAEGEHGKKDAAYVLHLDGLPAGGFENHRDGIGWENWHAEIGRTLTDAEREHHRARMETMQQQRQAEKAAREQRARDTAGALWKRARRCTKHPYLERKGIKAHGARILSATDAYGTARNLPSGMTGDLLLIPVWGTDNTLHSLQLMTATGEKRFLPGGRKRGCYFAIGTPDVGLCIAEGFATAASIHESTGCAVAVAFDACNLIEVARALRDKFPSIHLVICADDDHRQ